MSVGENGCLGFVSITLVIRVNFISCAIYLSISGPAVVQLSLSVCMISEDVL